MIRPARDEDLPAILDIYNEAILNTTAIYDYKPHSLEDRAAWLAGKTAAGLPVLVWEEDGAAAGFATFGPFRPWPAYKYSIEHSIYVHKAMRGRHIGSRLLEMLLRLAEERGYAVMVAGIDADNAVSRAMHEKAGFAHTGTIRKAGYKFGRWLDLVFYQRLLRGPAVPTED